MTKHFHNNASLSLSLTGQDIGEAVSGDGQIRSISIPLMPRKDSVLRISVVDKGAP